MYYLRDKAKIVALEEDWGRVIVIDSLAEADSEDTGQVIVAGSHGSDFAARYAALFLPFGLILNDAGKGMDDAGISGLPVLEAMGVLGATVDCMTARIGEGQDAYQNGCISAVNNLARSAGIEVGQEVAEAANRMLAAKRYASSKSKAEEIYRDEMGRIFLSDTITCLNDTHRGAVVVCGSHCAWTTFHWVKSIDLKGIILNDAGRGKEDAGISGLPRYQAANISAAAVDCMTARIGHAKDAWEFGLVSAANELAEELGVTPGLEVRQAAMRMLMKKS